MSELIGVLTCQLKPGTNANDFERFMHEELLPAYRGLPGCLEANLLRAIKGAEDNLYVSISRWESLEANDAVFGPEENLPAPYAEAQEHLYGFVLDAKWAGYISR